MAAATRKRKVFGVIAEVPVCGALHQAAERVRDRGYRFWACLLAFSNSRHDAGDGAKKRPLGYIIFSGGFIGFLTAVFLEFIPRVPFLFPPDSTGKLVNFFTS